MNPSLRDQLKKWQDLHQEPAPKKKTEKPPPPKKNVEKLSDRDLTYLMGTGRQILYRRKGALKQK